MNKVILCGRICHDLELKYTPNGTAVQNNTLAINKKQKNGENKTLFIKFTVLGKGAEILNQYAQKGSRIFIEGEIDLNEYQKQNGEKVSEYKVIALSCEILDFKQNATPAQPTHKSTKRGGLVAKKQSVDISEDELPF